MKKNFCISGRLRGEFWTSCVNRIDTPFVFMNGIVIAEIPGKILFFLLIRDIVKKSWRFYKEVRFYCGDDCRGTEMLDVEIDNPRSFNFKIVVPNSFIGVKTMFTAKHIAPKGCSWAPASTYLKFKISELKISKRSRTLQPAFY